MSEPRTASTAGALVNPAERIDMTKSKGIRPRLLGRSLEQKLLLNHTVTPEGCWRWTRGHTAPGYGEISIDSRMKAVHRLAYELWVGPIPPGLVIDHVAARGCVHRDCINPEHLEPVTNSENLSRAPNNPAVRAAKRTHCKNGHEFTPENTYVRPDDGARVCRACWQERRRRQKAQDESGSRTPNPARSKTVTDPRDDNSEQESQDKQADLDADALMALYGPCEVCGAPRDVRTTQRDLEVLQELVCTAFPDSHEDRF